MPKIIRFPISSAIARRLARNAVKRAGVRIDPRIVAARSARQGS